MPLFSAHRKVSRYSRASLGAKLIAMMAKSRAPITPHRGRSSKAPGAPPPGEDDGGAAAAAAAALMNSKLTGVSPWLTRLVVRKVRSPLWQPVNWIRRLLKLALGMNSSSAAP